MIERSAGVEARHDLDDDMTDFHSFPKSFFTNVLNKLDFLIKMFIGSFQEAIKKIQELTKINRSEPPSFHASERLPPLPPEMLAAARAGHWQAPPQSSP